ncbi:DUF6093 family protein [Brevibacterium oceani]|uniref:DUF6093 family protein n=1 Tax=Brevibacterium oceani TaxID=358099 RepID=UPI0015E721D7|nr:DUF6093 family protein [Brevibacterium oceani]
MSARAAILQGRRLAESLMVDQWRIYRVEKGAVDDLTGLPGPDQQITVYEGKGKLQSYEGYERNPETIGHTSTVQRMSLHLPVGGYRPQVDHVAVCVDSFDANLVGTEYRITQDAPFKSLATAYRAFVDFKAA